MHNFKKNSCCNFGLKFELSSDHWRFFFKFEYDSKIPTIFVCQLWENSSRSTFISFSLSLSVALALALSLSLPLPPSSYIHTHIPMSTLTTKFSFANSHNFRYFFRSLSLFQSLYLSSFSSRTISPSVRLTASITISLLANTNYVNALIALCHSFIICEISWACEFECTYIK